MDWIKRHKILSAILVIIVLAIIGGGASGDKNKSSNESNNNTNNSSTSDDNKADDTKKIGDTARDGKFEFKVTSFNCDKTEVVSPDSDALRKTAQGKYCVMAVTVKNVGNEAQGFFSTNQKLLDAGNKQYAADDVATSYNSPMSQQNTWAQINPGNSIDATIVFDIPKDANATTAQLHDSAFSGGVKVKLN